MGDDNSSEHSDQKVQEKPQEQVVMLGQVLNFQNLADSVGVTTSQSKKKQKRRKKQQDVDGEN